MFPSYLLVDPGFWWFSLLYVVAVVVIVALCIWPLSRMSSRPAVASSLPLWLVILFTYLIIEQFFHQAEHITQMYQFQFLGMPASSSKGFVWFLDDEWNHFTFNGLYLTGLTIVFIPLLRRLRATNLHKVLAHTLFIGLFFIVEGWHMTEHTWRIIQHVQGLCEQCTGFLDVWTGIHRLIIHFWFNLAALVLPCVVYVWFGIPGLLGQMLRRLFRVRVPVSSMRLN